MPWKSGGARRHTRKANTPAKRSKWARVANAVLRRTGSESSAIRIANSKVRKKSTRGRKRR